MVKEIIIKISLDEGKLTTATIEKGFTNDVSDRLLIIGALENLKGIETDKLKNGMKHSEASFKDGLQQ